MRRELRIPGRLTGLGGVAMLWGAVGVASWGLGEVVMGDMLQQGGRFPRLELRLADGGGLVLPGDAPSRYTALLFYRGHW